jgi:hypothetical protein
MKLKAVYLNGTPIGSAGTWHEVAELVGRILRRQVSMREIFRPGSEGSDGFYIRMPDDDQRRS